MLNSAVQIDMARHQVMFQHNPSNTQGYITIAQKDRDGRFIQKFYTPEKLANHLTNVMGEDVFVSQNTFYRKSRRIETIRQLRSLYVDLDFYIFNYSPEWVLAKLEYDFYRQSIPEPNMIIFSGQGIVLIWLIEPAPYMALPLWQAVQNYLIKQLQELGGDTKASDAARVFRLAGTKSSKNGNEVHVQYRHDYVYSLREIQDEYLPELKPPKEKKKKPGRKKKVINLFNLYTLHNARLHDLARLVTMRNGEMDGYREVTLFLYRYWSSCFENDSSEGLRQTLEFNQTFTCPLPQNEVIRATTSAQKAFEAKSNKAADEKAKSLGFPGAGYRISNAKIIKWLDITADEQKHLKTIIGGKEKRRRDLLAKEQKRREAGMRPMAEYNKERHDAKMSKVEILRITIQQYPDLSNRKLAEILGKGWSEPTIRRLKKQLLV